MAIMLICLYPEESLPSMHNLRLIADPRRTWKKHVASQNIEQSEQKRL